MNIELHDQFGNISLTKIAEQMDAVSQLTEPQQLALADLISAVKTKEAATERFVRAQRNVITCEQAHDAALAAHQAANPPPSQIEALRLVQAAYNSQTR